MSREVGVSDTEELWNGKLHRVFLAPAHIPSFSPVQEMNLSRGSAGALTVQHDHSAGARHGARVPFHLVAAQPCQPCPQGGREQVLG